MPTPRPTFTSPESTTVVSPSRWLIVALLVVVLIVIGGGVYAKKMGWLNKAPTTTYQAVFLTNGQVYFGKVSNRRSAYVALTDVYYLQQRERQRLQEPQEDGEKNKKEQPAQPRPQEPELSLIKLGQELHGPEDRIEINRNQVLFIEDLRDDGKVVQAIKRHQEGKK